MLEIIALYFILKEVGKLAHEKGYSALRWKVNMVLAWIFGEFTGVFLVQIFYPGQLWMMLVIGLSMAYLSYLLLRQYWLNLPDKHEEDDQ